MTLIVYSDHPCFLEPQPRHARRTNSPLPTEQNGQGPPMGHGVLSKMEFSGRSKKNGPDDLSLVSIGEQCSHMTISCNRARREMLDPGKCCTQQQRGDLKRSQHLMTRPLQHAGNQRPI